MGKPVDREKFQTIQEIAMSTSLGPDSHQQDAAAVPVAGYEELLQLESKDIACLIDLFSDINLLTPAELEEYDGFFEPASS